MTVTAQTQRRSSLAAQVGGILLIVLPLFAPELLISFTPLHAGASMVIAGILPVIIAWPFAPRYALACIPLAGMVNAVAVLVHGDRAATTVYVVVLAVALGLSARAGLHVVGMFVALQPVITVVSGYHTVAFGDHVPGTVGQAVLFGAIAVGGGLWAVAIAALLLRDEVVGPPEPVPWPIVVFYTAALTVLLGVAAFVASTWFLGTTAGWVLLTIVLVLRPTYDESRRMVAERAAGTVVGAIASAFIALLVSNTTLLVGLGTLAMVVAAVLQLLHARYVYFAAFVTAAVALVNAEHVDVWQTDVERVVWTAVGVLAVATVVAAAEASLGRYSD